MSQVAQEVRDALARALRFAEQDIKCEVEDLLSLKSRVIDASAKLAASTARRDEIKKYINENFEGTK